MKITANDILQIFGEICAVPRPSKHESQIRDYLLQFARRHQLSAQTDAIGNVLVVKPGPAESICLQAHMDMVCENTADTRHNFETDPIQTYEEDGWLRARGTTLGADDGIGMAIALAALLSDSPHRIEALFTVDEETGLTGASELQAGWLQSRKLINLDSEEDDEFIVGCAGGCETTALFPIEQEQTQPTMFGIKLIIKGLQGGHSGSDIHFHRANALLLLGKFLEQESQRYEVRIAEIKGGNLHNAIPREAEAVIAIPIREKEQIRIDWNIYWAEVEEQWLQDEPQLQGTLSSTPLPKEVFTSALSQNLTNAIANCRHGVVAWSETLPDIVETSTNLASVKREDIVSEPDDKGNTTTTSYIAVHTSQRSSDDAALSALAFGIYEHFAQYKALPYISGQYTGWKPDFESPLVRQAVEAYTRLFGKSPAVKVIHAGLECGVFRQRYPQLDMISIGPTLRDVHSPAERLKLSSIGKVWALTEALLEA
ncbi:MAG: beta-Ala-His dipeptidase [Paludibacteraceae bacterium]|nr:beta-Ala-His dipeptidase [Paludibacteraceae bacterium]